MKKALVTGGAGFIGSHLVTRLLKEGYEVVVADTLLRGNKIPKKTLDQIEFHNADVRNKELMQKLSKGCEIIYHFAAVLGVDVVADNPIETMDTEVIGMKNICEAALHHGINKIMYASTSGIYGYSAINQSFNETILVDPRTSYAIAKRYNEIYLSAMRDEKGLQSTSLRFFNIYGPGQDNRMVIPRFIEQAKNNEPITVFGNGKQTRDFTFIDDAIQSCILLTEKIIGSEIFNVSNEQEFPILQVAETIKELTGSKSIISLIDAPKKRYDFEVERRIGSSDKLMITTGFKPRTNLVDGLKQII